jgi:hypothetical protein
MPSERWFEPGDPAIYRSMRNVCRMGVALAGSLRVPPGVYKYRSAEDAHADRERWEDQRIQRIRNERLKK